MSGPDLSDDGVLLALLAAALDDMDPVPAAAVAAAVAAREICHADGELAALVADPTSEDSVFALRDEADIKLLTFVSPRVTVEVEIGLGRRAIGVISPPVSTVIKVETSSNQWLPPEMARSDEFGRFQVEVGIGLCRLRIGSGSEAVVTSWFYC